MSRRDFFKNIKNLTVQKLLTHAIRAAFQTFNKDKLLLWRSVIIIQPEIIKEITNPEQTPEREAQMHPNSLHTHTHQATRIYPDRHQISQCSLLPRFSSLSSTASQYVWLSSPRSPSSTFQTDRRSTEACDFHETIDPRSVRLFI